MIRYKFIKNRYLSAKEVTLIEQKEELTSDPEKNIQNGLRSGEVKKLSSTISRYLFDTGHQVDTLKSLKLPNIQSNPNLKFAGPTVIKHLKAELYVEKETVINLSLS